MKAANREILLSFWKVHILHHAGEEPIHGQWILTELRRHGHDISPGTLYPLLNRMERLGWLACKVTPRGGPRARKDYHLTAAGRKVLALIREQLEELYKEVVRESKHKNRKPKNEPARSRPIRIVQHESSSTR
ncbi:MAG TPA: PadR family transcriptional regulator [Verrucomicrobiae bacterium]|nr:PadR family transcriptional regulator [Verrucomicrobiae bacterium]